jgi:hypothetical protein
MSYPPFSWDATVDLVQIWPAMGYRDTVERMSMRQAVDAFLRLPEDAQLCCAVEPVEPYREDGVIWSYLSPQAVADLARRRRS